MALSNNGLLSRASDASEASVVARIISDAQMDILSAQIENNGDLRKSELKEILDTYFVEVPDLDAMLDSDIYNATIKTKEGGYSVTISEVYNGGFKTLAAGLYDSNYNLIYDWQRLIDIGYINVDGATLKDETNTTMSDILVIDSSITQLSDKAFYNCDNLKEVILPNNLQTIGNESFRGCGKLEKINIPDSITGMFPNNYSTFSGCSNLKTVVIGNGVSSIGGGAFMRI